MPFVSAVAPRCGESQLISPLHVRRIAVKPWDDHTHWIQQSKLQISFARQVPNPFKPGEMMTVHPSEDAVDIIFDGRSAGSTGWSMSDEPQVNATIEVTALPLVPVWAEAFEGEFRPLP